MQKIKQKFNNNCVKNQYLNILPNLLSTEQIDKLKSKMSDEATNKPNPPLEQENSVKPIVDN
jgi:hypothetical protein